MGFLKYVFLLCPLFFYSQKNDRYLTSFEKGNGNQTTTYKECMNYYQNLDANFETIKVVKMGLTDSGENLQVVLFDKEKKFKFDSKSKKAVILINNGIHAGEPDGIDATMQFYRDLATGKLKSPENVLLVSIPIYNIGGSLNRNSTTRVNQNGPEEYGFRGNSRNFDLNRDFIKSDTKNTKSFIDIFHTYNPDIFIDNHVSNGADYQYTLTYIMTEPKKLGTVLGNYTKEVFTPEIVKNLQQKNIETTPYVNVWHGTPYQGFEQFFDSPRYATGYASLFNSIGFVVETHMLKKYSDRVNVTYEFMVTTMKYVNQNYKIIKEKRVENEKQFQAKQKYALKWIIDSSKVSKIPFLGFEGSYKKSEVTSGDRLFYDRDKPYKKDINFYGDFKPVNEIIIPNFYLIPKAFWTITDLLKLNKIQLKEIKKDSIIEVQSYRIADYKTAKNPYEGHYPHNATKVETSVIKKQFFKGDFLVSTNQKGVKYLLETLEPEAIDSFFNWNFFDTILQQKEGYSEYVFEDLAFDFLNRNSTIKEKFNQKKLNDKQFAENPEAQLDWVHKNSPYYEKAHLNYPIFRIVK